VKIQHNPYLVAFEKLQEKPQPLSYIAKIIIIVDIIDFSNLTI